MMMAQQQNACGINAAPGQLIKAMMELVQSARLAVLTVMLIENT